MGKLRCKFCKGLNVIFSDAKKAWDEDSTSVCLNVHCEDCNWDHYSMIDVQNVVDPEGRI